MSTVGVVSEWYDTKLKDKFLDSVVCPGDILEFNSNEEGKIHHWAVYVGHHEINGWTKACVVHCRNNCCNNCIPGSTVTDALFGAARHAANNERQIVKDKFDDVLDTFVRISNVLDHEWEPHGGDQVVQRAFLKLSEQVDIEGANDDWVVPPLFGSCKHFALWCRYDENYINSLAETAQNKASAIKTGFAAVGVGAAAAGLGYLLWSKCSKTKEKPKTKEDE